MKRPRVLCIFTTILGNKVTAQHLLDALNSMESVDLETVLIGADDFRNYPAPRWARLTRPHEVRYVAHRKMTGTTERKFDILLVNCWEFITQFRDIARRVPSAALMDAVPATIGAQMRRLSGGGWKRTLADAIHDIPFRSAVRDFRYFLPMGSDSADALEHRYGIPRDRCTVTLAPQDLSFWTPETKQACEKLRLLFVTSNFHLKGGEFLLRLYSGHLADGCTLQIVTNDSALEKKTLPPGVTWIRGADREEVRRAYRGSDLLLYPTQRDFMPQVLTEALSVGLPCIASDIGGIRDLIHDGETGWLMPPDASTEAWAGRVASLRADTVILESLAVSCRSFAERNLDPRQFRDKVVRVTEKLLAECEAGAGVGK